MKIKINLLYILGILNSICLLVGLSLRFELLKCNIVYIQLFLFIHFIIVLMFFIIFFKLIIKEIKGN